jgi:hypothetical protein
MDVVILRIDMGYLVNLGRRRRTVGLNGVEVCAGGGHLLGDAQRAMRRQVLPRVRPANHADGYVLMVGHGFAFTYFR